ncbi:MAG TPA: Cys-tRNA(Pro) deacylase [Leucothrix mucor]|nr:Cys-tRNA(Pro) deacylase [Leucothrix mucor]
MTTPAAQVAKKANIAYTLHKYKHDPHNKSYGEEAANLLDLNPAQVFKTLLLSLNTQANQLAVAILPVSRQLNFKAFAKIIKAKKIAMADPQKAQNVTGYLLGGISPLGQKKRLPMIIDETAFGFETIYVSAGKRGLEIELSADDLVLITGAKTGLITVGK